MESPFPLGNQLALPLWRSDRSPTKAHAEDRESQDREQDHVVSTRFEPCSIGALQPRRPRELTASFGGKPTNLNHTGSWSPNLAISFEASTDFYPETYTMRQRLPQSTLFVTRAHEAESFCDFKTNVYRVLYMKSHRQWCRLTISVKIHRSSIYWNVTKVSHHKCQYPDALPLVGHASFPYSLFTKIQALLQDQNLADDDNPHFSLEGENSIRKQIHHPDSNPSTALDGSSSMSTNVLGFLDDLGCMRYHESEVTQVEVFDAPRSFVSCIGGTLVCEVKVVNSSPSSELLYTIRVLHIMDGCPGFAKLIGVVVDNMGKRLKSYLVELPRARCTLMHAVGDQPLPWKRREKWARQLVEGISQLHSKGFVAGTLFGGLSPFITADSDRIQFWYFLNRFRVGQRGKNCYYPPEFRHLEKLPRPTGETGENKSQKLTSKTDIFHLGFLLWLLAENLPQTSTSPVCIRERCHERVGRGCNKSHFDPIVLPDLPESIPIHYRKIVDACWSPDPDARPAARKLLKLFPSVDDSMVIQQEVSTSKSTELSAWRSSLVGTVDCDQCCRRRVEPPFFHCNTCENGDFDICQACYEQGKHCYDASHLLVELLRVGSLIVPGKYYSCMNVFGRREIVAV